MGNKRRSSSPRVAAEADVLPSEWVRGLAARLTTRQIDLGQVHAEVVQVFHDNPRPTVPAVSLVAAIADSAILLRLAADGNHLEIGEFLVELARMREEGEI